MRQEQQPRFSIRKLSIGAVSVMFGLTLFGNHNQVHAATTDDKNAEAETSQVSKEETDNNSEQQEKATILKTAEKPTQQILVVKQNENTDANTQTQVESSNTQQVKSVAPTPGADYSAEEKKNAPALIEDPKTKSDTDSEEKFVDKNGVETKFTINAKNKNTDKETTIDIGKTTKNVIYNSGVAEDGNFNIIITNPTDKAQPITGFGDYAYTFPAWGGTSANLVVDSDRTKVDSNGNIVFGGDYSEKGLILGGFSIANDGNGGSSGFGRSAADAAKDPARIGGFVVTGTLAAGQTATIQVPFKYKDPTKTTPVVTSDGISRYYGVGVNLHNTEYETSLDNQVGKDYFLVTLEGGSSQTDFHSIPQTVIDALIKDGLYPTYQDGDAVVKNFTFGKDESEDYLTKEATVSLTNAYKRLDSVLRQYGYQLGNLWNASGIPNGYFYKPNYKFYDAQGQQIQLGTGNISNFFIPVVQVIAQTSTEPLAFKAQGVGDDDTTYQQVIKNAISDGATVDVSNVDIHKAGVYKVKAVNGNVSRVFDVVVYDTQTPVAYKTGDAKHVDLTVDKMFTKDGWKALQDEGYTVEWNKEPDYTSASNNVPVSVKITDPDGRSFVDNNHVNVYQKLTVNFIDQDNNLVKSLDFYSYANGSNSLKDIVTWSDSSAIKTWKDTLAELDKDYLIDSQSVQDALKTEFLAQKDDQVVTVDVTKKQGKSDDNPTLDDRPIAEIETRNYTRTINYVDENGKTIKDPTVQTVTERRIIEKNANGVTQKIGDWSKANFDEVKVPEIDGYFTTEKDVPSKEATDNEEVTLHYTKKQSETGNPTITPENPALNIGTESRDLTRTVNYVDEKGKSIKDPTVQTVTETRTVIKNEKGEVVKTLDWSKANFDEVKVPEIDGYFTSEKDVPAKEAIGNEEITLHYTKKQSETGDPTITPEKPKLNIGTESRSYTRTINYVDEMGKSIKDPTVQTITETRTVIKDAKGNVVKTLDWSKANFDEVKVPEIDGYFTTEKDVPSKEATDNEEITLHYTKKQSKSDDNPTVTPELPKFDIGTESRDLTRTINYVDENGKSIKDPTVQTVTETRTVIKNEKGEVVKTLDWSKANFDEVKVPEIDGYFTTEKDVPSKEATDNEEITLHYTKKQGESDDDPTITPENPVYPMPHPEPNPDPQPQPDQPVTPDQPDIPAPHGEDKPTNPNQKPDNGENVKPHANTKPSQIVVENNEKTTKVTKAARKTQDVDDADASVRPLPQTGAKQNNAGIIGLALAGAASLLGLAADRKKKN